jgi:ATP-dependent protease ClpP protease subunit
MEEVLDGQPVLAYFTSFRYAAPIGDDDADIIEGMLKKEDIREQLNQGRGLCLVLSSPGGSPLAAERITHMCRHYSKGKFTVLVPRSAKSAATLIALGANRLLMGATAELGPIDLQITRFVEGYGGQLQRVRTPMAALINHYDRAINQAVNIQSGQNAEPLYRELQAHDPIKIQEWRHQEKLSGDIAERALTRGMLADQEEGIVKGCVELFADWNLSLTHDRAIFPEALCAKGVPIEMCPEKLELLAPELYVELDRFVSTTASKVVASARHLVCTPRPEIDSVPALGAML